MGMYVLPKVKKKGAYGAGGCFQSWKNGKNYTFRADRTGGNMCIQKKVGAFRANRTEKVDAFRANKTEKKGGGGFTAAHTRTALIWEYPLRAPGDINVISSRPSALSRWLHHFLDIAYVYLYNIGKSFREYFARKRAVINV